MSRASSSCRRSPSAEFHKVLEEASGICLGVQPFSDPELDAAPQLEVVSRIGVGYDAVDVPALTRRKVPLMIGGTANSVSVAEAGVFLTMSLARKGAAMDAMVKEGRWHDRYKDMPVDLYGKTVLIIGFGKIGTRSARRFAAMETNVLVYDPYMYSETIRGIGLRAGRRISTRRWRAPISSRSTARRRRRRSACSTPPARQDEAHRLSGEHRARRHRRREGALRRAQGGPHRRRRARRLCRGADAAGQPAPDPAQFHRRAACRRGDPARRSTAWRSSRCRTSSRSSTASRTRENVINKEVLG